MEYVSGVIAIIALILNWFEIRAQNKQCLFEKRLKNYIACKKLFRLVKDSENLLTINNNDGPLEVTTLFQSLTNCGFLAEGSRIITDTTNHDNKVRFLKKMEALETMAEKNKLLFSCKISDPTSRFLLSIQSALMQLYQYQVLLECIYDGPSFKNHKSFKEIQEEYGEEEYRKKVIESVNNLKNIASIIRDNNILDKLSKETKLSRLYIPHTIK